MRLDRLWTLVGRKITGEATETELQELLDMLHQDPYSHHSLQAISQLWQMAFYKDQSNHQPVFTSDLHHRASQNIVRKFRSLGLEPAREYSLHYEELEETREQNYAVRKEFEMRQYFCSTWKTLVKYNFFILGLLGLSAARI